MCASPVCPTGCGFHALCVACAARLTTCPLCRRRLPWIPPTPPLTPEGSDDDDPVQSMARLLAAWRCVGRPLKHGGGR